MVKVNYSLLPMKAHYFFFMAAMGPVLPFLPVFSKQLGVSEVVFGSMNAVLPIMFIIAKPVFGYIIDFFHKRRKIIFIIVIIATSVFYFLMMFIPSSRMYKEIRCGSLKACNWDDSTNVCVWRSGNSSVNFNVDQTSLCISSTNFNCLSADEIGTLSCKVPDSEFYLGFPFWIFAMLLSLGTIGFNVSNSISDAICFNVLGDGSEMKYGQQRVFGTIGFGLAALLGGFSMDYINADVADSDVNYFPAFSIAFLCMIFDVLCCSKLELPPLPKSENIVRDIIILMKQPHIATFITFAVMIGICDATVIYYLFWYLEDMAQTNGFSSNIKLLEGLTVAVETLCGEVVMFPLAGKIISKVGYGNCLSMCFGFYALRLALIAIIPSPWWIIPVEMFMQGPTYALGYTTIVAYASAVAPPGTSATTQGIVAGMDDGLGFSIGSLVGGLIFRYYNGRVMYGAAAVLAFICCLTHCILFNIYFKHSIKKPGNSSPLKALASHESRENAIELETSTFLTDQNNGLH